MSSSDIATFRITIQDSDISPEDLQQVVRAIAGQLEPDAYEISFTDSLPAESDVAEVPKGGQLSSILDVKININTLRVFGGWLYRQLVGTSTKVRFQYKEVTYEVEGREKDQEIAMQNFQKFLEVVRANEEQK